MIRPKRQQENHQKPILTQLWLTFSSFALIPIILVGVASIFVSIWSGFEDIERNLMDSANQISIVTDNKLEEMAYISETIAENKAIKELLRKKHKSNEELYQFHEEMKKMISTNAGRSYYITVCGMNGQIYVNYETDGMIYRDSLTEKIRAYSWFPQLEDYRGLPVWVTDMDNPSEFDKQKKVVTIARNIMNTNLGGEEILGFVIVSISSDKLSENLVSSTEKIYAVNEDNTIVMSQDLQEIGTTLQGVTEQQGRQVIKKDGDIYLGYRKHNQQGGIDIITITSGKALVKNLYLLFGLIAVALLCSVVIIFIVARRVAYTWTRPIMELVASMDKIRGNVLEKAEIKTDISEIGSLLSTYNFMIERIQQLIKEKIQEEQRRKEIEKEKVQAELKFLRAQINPHFLFNTLNSIKWLARIHGVTPVEEMLIALGRLLECSMQRGNDFIPLSEEIENVKAYLKIQEMRYGNKIRTEYIVEKDIQQSVVPKLILQPLVENAIIHGIDQNADGGTISIRTWEQGTDIFLSVEDDGPGFSKEFITQIMDEDEGKEKRLGGIGIGNINKRLFLIYGEGYGLHYEGKEKGTIAVLKIKKEEHHVEDHSGR